VVRPRPDRPGPPSPRSPLYDDLAEALGSRAVRDQPLAPMTTYGVGGSAALYIELRDADDVDLLRSTLKGHGVPLVVVGRGSNLLVSDGGFEGVAVRLGPGFGSVQLPASRHAGDDPFVVRAGGAAPLPALARRVADAGWSGLAWAVGVPGSVGGAVRMNAGGHGSDMAACLHRYTWVDLLGEGEGTDDVARLRYGYRSSSVGPSELVLEAQLLVAPGEVESERAEVSSIVRWRRTHQPGGSNAGSVFTNPPGDSAGRLIEQAGLKGCRMGTAHVSERHANFIQADKGGRAADVRSLMAYVADVVLDRCGVALSPEVRLLGFPDSENGGMAHEGVAGQ
jgi:UDP-N-acetylmuramate dehydrogenase